MSTPLVINLSQSALGSHGCILELYRTAVQGYCETPSSNIVYGEAVHKYRHIMFQTNGHIPTAREEALKTFAQPKTPAPKRSGHMEDSKHMLTTAFTYWEEFIKADKDTEIVLLNGKPATEVSFSIPFYKDNNIEVNLCGTLDGISKIKGGCYIVQDLKTTSSWDERAYFSTYKLSRQLRMYVLALRLMSEMHPESILGQVGKTKVGARIDGVFIKTSAMENKYLSSEVMFYSDEELIEFRRTFKFKCMELSYNIQNNYFPKQGILNASCIGKWGLCKFSNVCAVSDDNVAELLLARDFKKRDFNPLNYSGL